MVGIERPGKGVLRLLMNDGAIRKSGRTVKNGWHAPWAFEGVFKALSILLNGDADRFER